MPWPSSQDYNEAIQNSRTSFADDELRGGQAATNALGVPLPRSGNFADVYEFTGVSGNKWAIKCFTREIPGLQERYHEISLHLQKAKLPFTVDFQYLAQGIRIHGQWYPILKMHWVEGLLLNEFIRDNLDKSKTLEGLSEVWLRMARWLRDAGIAHGDLQHGNVIMVPGSKATSLAVKLIDYDGMFVPALAGKPSSEVGHANFQHPERLRNATYDAEVDRLPLLAVTCALRALVVGGKTLWDKYDNGDNLLFRELDLRRPAGSALLRELWNTDDNALHDLVGYLALGLSGALEYVPNITDLIQGNGPTSLTPAQEQWLVSQFGAGAVRRPLPGQLAQIETTAIRPLAAKSGAADRARESIAEPGKGPPPPKRKTQPAETASRPRGDSKATHGPSIFARKKSLLIGSGVAAAVVLVAVAVLVATWSGKKPLRNEPIAPAGPKVDGLRVESAANPDIDPANASNKGENQEKRDLPEVGLNPVPIVREVQSIGFPKGEFYSNVAVLNARKELLLGSEKFKLWNPGKGDVRIYQNPNASKAGRAVSHIALTTDRKKFFGAALSDAEITLWDLESSTPLATLAGHTKPITHLLMSPDGTTLLSASEDGSVLAWDPAILRERSRWTLFQEPITALALSPSGEQVFLASRKLCSWWDWKRNSSSSKDSKRHIWSAAFSPDGNSILAVTYEGILEFQRDSLSLIAEHKGHPSAREIVFTPSRTSFLTFGYDKRICLWDWKTRKVIKAFEGNIGDIAAVTCSSDGKWLYSCGQDHIRIWPLGEDAITLANKRSESKPGPAAQPIPKLNPVVKPAPPLVMKEIPEDPLTVVTEAQEFKLRASDPLFNLIKTKNSKELVLGSMQFQLWNPNSGTIRYFDRPGGSKGGNSLAHMALARGGTKFFGSLLSDSAIFYWDVRESKPVGKLVGHTGAVRQLVLSPDGKKLLSSSDDGTIRIWDASTLKEIGRLLDDTKLVRPNLAISPDGSRVFVSSQDSKGYLVDFEGRKQLLSTRCPLQTVTAFSPDGVHIVGANSNFLYVLSGETLKVEDTLLNHPSISGLLFTPDGKHLLTFGYDNMLRLWDWPSKKVRRIYVGHTGQVSGAVCTDDGKWIYSCCSGVNNEGRIRRWPLDDSVIGANKPPSKSNILVIKDPRRFRMNDAFVTIAATQGSPKVLLAGSRVVGWNPESGETRRFGTQSFKGGTNMAALAATPDGKKFFATTMGESSITLWDVATAQPEGQLVGHSDSVAKMVTSPDGKFLVSSGLDGVIRQWDAKKLTEIRILREGKRAAQATLAISPDSSKLFASCVDQKAYVWNLKTGVQLLEAPFSYQRDAKFTPDGSRIVTANGAAVNILDPQTLKHESFHFGHPQVGGILFTPGGKQLISYGNDHMLRLWDWKNKKVMQIFVGHRSPVAFAACSPDGKWIYSCSAGADGVYQWPLDTEVAIAAEAPGINE